MATELRQLFHILASSDNTLLRETMLYGVLTRLMLKHGKSRNEIRQQQTSNQKLVWVSASCLSNQQRLHKSKSLLRQGNKVVDVATDIGFYDQSHFHRHFKKANGVTPSRYARQVG